MKNWYAVIGDPIAHSMSPFMHDTWFREHGIDAAYIPLHVKPETLDRSVDAMKLLGISGLNVTLPHKQKVIPYLDGLDETASTMNAVNTIVREGTAYIGHNTDGDGFVRSLTDRKVGPDSKTLLIGAGGAARGIVFAMKRAGFADITICNRTYQKARELATETGSDAKELSEVEETLSEFEVIIQTTSLGLSKDDSLPISLKHLNPDSFVADIIYNPLKTPFLLQAEEKGCHIMNGVGMFVYQGAIAFEKWTGVTPNTERMIGLITDKLGGSYVNR
jgi:shikimate dehydrogenase